MLYKINLQPRIKEQIELRDFSDITRAIILN